jgi:hypothetical protein
MVRGLLCSGCNFLVGILETRKRVLQKALEYIAFPPSLRLLSAKLTAQQLQNDPPESGVVS